jgi:hypothetical protein
MSFLPHFIIFIGNFHGSLSVVRTGSKKVTTPLTTAEPVEYPKMGCRWSEGSASHLQPRFTYGKTVNL